ncbi:MAG: hypothetical protein J6K41_13020 [Paraprevotella sp.]|nr:hypothetical protein [Paraprevotella sp.]
MIPCIYDSIASNKYVICVCCNKKWGVFDSNLKSIVPIKYEIFNKDDINFDQRPVLVCKNGYYGILNINISKPNDMSSWNGELKHISEIVPCVYNALYNEYGMEIEPHTVNSYFLNRIYFVNKDNETLHCYKYKLQKNEEVNSLPTYTTIKVKEFVCESFKIVDGCFMCTNRDISTITVRDTQLSIQLDGKGPTKIISLPQGNKHLLQIGKDLLAFENGKLIESIKNVELRENQGMVYGLRKDGKYAIYTPEFVLCTPFEYDSLSINCIIVL